jgi:hypothetical protein
LVVTVAVEPLQRATWAPSIFITDEVTRYKSFAICPLSSIRVAMDSLDLLEFAQAAISRVMVISARLGAETKLQIYGTLAAELCNLNAALEFPSSPDQEDRYRRRVGKLLTNIEKVCTVSTRI